MIITEIPKLSKKALKIFKDIWNMEFKGIRMIKRLKKIHVLTSYQKKARKDPKLYF